MPLLMVGTNLLNRSTEAQNRRQYAMVEQINHLTDQIHTMLTTQDEMVRTLITMAELDRQALQHIAAKTEEIDAEVDAVIDHHGLTVSTEEGRD